MGDQRTRQPAAWTLIGLGSYNVGCLLAGMGLGWAADSRWETSPALTLAGLLVGIGAGVLGSRLRIRTFLDD